MFCLDVWDVMLKYSIRVMCGMWRVYVKCVFLDHYVCVFYILL